MKKFQLFTCMLTFILLLGGIPIHAQFAPTQDLDGDGIANQDDLDDDNDGILDADECVTNTRILNHYDDYVPAFTSGSSEDLNGGTFNFSHSDATTGMQFDYTLDYTTFASPGALINTNNRIYAQRGGIQQVQGGTQTFEFDFTSGPIYDFNFKLRDIDGSGTSTTNPNGYKEGVKVIGYLNGNSVSPTGIILQNDVVTSYTSQGELDIVSAVTGNTSGDNIEVIFEQAIDKLVIIHYHALGISSGGSMGIGYFYGNVACDTDGDGIPDYQDLDSDNDGCPDALESAGNSYTFNDLTDENYLAGAVDANGVPNGTNYGVGTSTDASAQADECDSCNANSTLFSDNDLDGVGDDCDLDDDNDGILDSEEGSCTSFFENAGFEAPVLGCPNTNSTFSILPVADVPGWYSTSLPGNRYVCGGNTGIQDGVIEIWESGLLGVYANEGNQFAEINGNNIGRLYQLFTVPSPGNYVLEYGFSHRGRAGDDTMRFGVVENNTFISSEDFTSGMNQWSEYYGSLAFSTSTTSIQVGFEAISTASGSNGSGNFIDAVEICVSYDTDGDGIPNYLDLDSDNDGCPDVVEAGHTDANGDGILDGTSVDSNGLIVGYDTGYSGTTTAVNDPNENSACCDATKSGWEDTDSDGIANDCDIDDDNDGVLDSEECYPVLDNGEEISTLVDGVTNDRNTWNNILAMSTVNSVLEDFESFSANDNLNTITPNGFTINVTNSSNVTREYDIDGSQYGAVPLSGALQGTIQVVGGTSYVNDVTSIIFTFNEPVTGFGINLGDSYDVSKDVNYKVKFDNTLVFDATGNVGAGTNGIVTDQISGEDFVVGNSTFVFFGYYDKDNPVSTVTIELDNGNYTNNNNMPSGSGDNFTFDDVSYIFAPCDTDGDGIPNYLDLDSDDDGCPDVNEAGVSPYILDNSLSVTLNDGVGNDDNGIATGTTLENAIVDLANGGDANGNGFHESLETTTAGTYDGTYDMSLIYDATLNNCVCYKPGTGTFLSSKVGISTINRHKAENDTHWPENVSSGYLVLDSKEKGFVITSLSSAEIDSLDKKEGMLVYDTDLECLKLYNGTEWHCLEQTCIDY